ncbi:aldehyde dehydrogenase family protein [Haladaptatus salinisoli]|uniref:aldehyde dehydrogenase family protein n=1 Tax=Haladaptatus salinisoli TaxID=2884876 RepID=UPI001D0AC625|nr:aldehyde dehydrogenase family protein [Haladaptatus salinisoli]
MQRENDSEYGTISEEVAEQHRTVADDILPDEPYGLLVGGEWVIGETGETNEATDATTGETLATYQAGTRDDVDRAVAAARDAFDGAWGQLSATQRADALFEIADEIEDRKVELARLDSLEMGKPNQHSLLVDMTITVEQFRHFASIARTAEAGRHPTANGDKLCYTRSEPYGVVGQISAWNFPSMFVAWKVAPALAAGNAVVFKPASRAVLSTLELGRIMDRILPDGTVNVVTGSGSEVGSAIANHEKIRKVALTGSTAAGRSVMRDAAETITPVSLELGGKSPNIVFPDADLEKAVEGTLISIFFNQGEQCTAGSRLYLHEDVADEFLERFTEEMERLTVGDPLSPTTDIGPLVDHDHLEAVRSYVETAKAEGARVLVGGERMDDGDLDGAPFFEPTVLVGVEPDHTVAREEIFGPVLSVFEWSERDEVVAQANDTEYGLTSGVWTTDLETAHEMAAEIEAGTVWVNTYNELVDNLPHGGYKQSGIGRELDVEAFDAYRQTKTVVCNFGNLPKFG